MRSELIGVLISILIFPTITYADSINLQSTKTQEEYNRSDPLTINIKAPWPAGISFHGGGDGSFYSDFMHKNSGNSRDYYAVDFNGALTQNEPVNDEGVLVLAVADGTVKSIDLLVPNNYGYAVVIIHEGGYESRYAHLKDMPLVSIGQKILQGDPLGYIGDSGATGSTHLHYAMYYCDPTLGESECNNPKNKSSQIPQPFDSYAEINDGDTITSTNYGVGYEQIAQKDVKDVDNLTALRHENFRTTYSLFGGQAEMFGTSTTPVKSWQNSGYFYQAFGPSFAKDSVYYGIESTLFDDGNIAYLLLKPIWDFYETSGGPNSWLGLPITHSYPWGNTTTNNLYTGYRNDFEHGSIIWETDGDYQILDEINAEWQSTFYELPNFSTPLLSRYDEYINLQWTPVTQCSANKNNNQLGASFTAQANVNLGVFTIYQIVVEYQGTVEIRADGKVIFSDSSSDKVKKGVSTSIQTGSTKLDVKFSQEPLEQASIKIMASKIFPVRTVYAAEDDVTKEMSAITESDLPVYIGYEPPPYPGSDTSTPPAPLPIGNIDSSTVLVLDTSGSMDEEDISGETKLQAAQRAADNIVNIVAAEAQQNNAITTKIGLVNYSNSAYANYDLTTDYTSLQGELQNLSANGGTGMAEGLLTGMELFPSVSSSEKHMIILLSDGVANVPIDSSILYDDEAIKQEVIDLAAQAGSQGICVYTIGFGIPSAVESIDVDLLKNVAAASGCGTYYNAQDSIQLANVFVDLRHTSMGNVVFEQTGQIAQDEEIDLGEVVIPANQKLALFTLNWPGSKLELTIKDPAGTTVDSSYLGATFSVSPSIVSVVIANPLAGNWRLGILGVDVPEGITTFNSVVSTRIGIATPIPSTPTPQAATIIPSGNGGSALAVFVMIVTAVAIGLFIYIQVKNRGKKSTLNSMLVELNGVNAGQTTLLRDGFTIGRNPSCSLQLNDPRVSRSHAQFRYTNGTWFIQDMGSSGGTYLNGQRISASHLTNGDQIHVGDNTFSFRIGGQ